MSSKTKSSKLLRLPLKSQRKQKRTRSSNSEDKIIRDIIWKDIKEILDLEIEREEQLRKQEAARMTFEFIRKFNESFE